MADNEQSQDPGPPAAPDPGLPPGGDRRRPAGMEGLERQLQQTTDAIAQLRESVDGERASRERTIAAWNERIEASDRSASEAKLAATAASLATKTATRSMKLAAFVACIALIAAILAWNSSSTANRAVNGFAASRTSSRIVACNSDNETAHKINAGNAAKRAILDADRELQAEIDSLVAPVRAAPPSADPAVAQRTKDYLAIAEASRLKVVDKLNVAELKIVEAFVPDRVCTADAVNAFYDAKPQSSSSESGSSDPATTESSASG